MLTNQSFDKGLLRGLHSEIEVDVIQSNLLIRALPKEGITLQAINAVDIERCSTLVEVEKALREFDLRAFA